MYSLSKPSHVEIERFLAEQRALPYSYTAVGATRTDLADAALRSYAVDHHRLRLGTGAADFERACAAVRRWTMFEMPWIELCSRTAPIEPGTTVAILVHACGAWSLNASRIVYRIDESGAVARFGFAYGTLPEHAESGEERFLVEWRRADDSVWYDLCAFSRPNQLVSRVARPCVRRLQRRFASDSLWAMQRAVSA